MKTIRYFYLSELPFSRAVAAFVIKSDYKWKSSMHVVIYPNLFPWFMSSFKDNPTYPLMSSYMQITQRAGVCSISSRTVFLRTSPIRTSSAPRPPVPILDEFKDVGDEASLAAVLEMYPVYRAIWAVHQNEAFGDKVRGVPRVTCVILLVIYWVHLFVLCGVGPDVDNCFSIWHTVFLGSALSLVGFAINVSKRSRLVPFLFLFCSFVLWRTPARVSSTVCCWHQKKLRVARSRP